MSTTTEPIVATIVGALMVVPGGWMIASPRRAARDNDTKGPAWVRNWNRSPGQKTTPLQAVLIGVVLLVVGGTLLVMGVLGLAGIISLS